MCHIVYMDKTIVNNRTQVNLHLDSRKKICFNYEMKEEPYEILNELTSIYKHLTMNINIIAKDMKTLVSSKRINAFYY